MSKQSKVTGNQDIRSFFQVKSTKKSQLTPSTPSTTSKRPARAIVSSDDDVIPESPLPEPKKQKTLKKRKINVVSSDSEDEKNFTKKIVKEDKNKHKAISALEAFGNGPIKQAKVPDLPKIVDKVEEQPKPKQKKDKKSKNKVPPTETTIHGDSDFEKTLLELDEDLLLQSVDELDRSIDQALKQSNDSNEKKIPKVSSATGETKDANKKHSKMETNLNGKTVKHESKIKDKNEAETTQNSKELKKENIQIDSSSKSRKDKKEHKKENTQIDLISKISKESRKDKKEVEGAVKKLDRKETKNENMKVDSRVKKTSISSSDDDKKLHSKSSAESESYEGDPDQERYEKKRYSAMLYQKYLNRSEPVHHGTKEIPKGKPDCLKNLCFLRTGVLDSLEQEEFEELITSHGGRVVHGVSKKVNYLVVGEDPGPAKLEKAKSYGITLVTEDELLDLIRTKSGLQAKIPKEEEKEKTNHDELQSKFLKPKPNESSKPKQQVESNVTSSSKLSNPSSSKLKKEVTSKSSKESPSKSSKESTYKSSNESASKSSKDSTLKFSKQSTSKSSDNSIPQSSNSSSTSAASVNNLAWTDKYKPTNIKGIIGQQGDKSNMKKLMVWLENWYKNHSGPNRPKLTKPSPWAKSDDGSYFKAALLSGSPGVGKTTTANLVAKELGFDVVEFNASDTRSKRLLHDEVSQLLANKSLAGFFTDGAQPTSKHVLLMDEVDGMAGNEDRGGMQELISLIKNSKVPIICMCNDRNHQKMRSLTNYCLDLRFARPRLEQIRGAMMSVCFKEGLKISPEALSEVIAGAGMDVRQILTNLSLWSTDKTLSTETASKEAKSAKKDTPLGPWEVCRKVFSAEEHKTMSITDRARLFYYDYSLAPLFVQDNYLGVVPHAPKEEHLKRFSLAADAISMGDLIDSKIRRTNNWSLLDIEAMCSSVLPGHYLEGHVKQQIGFPSWLGKNSKKNKFSRMLSELQAHMRLSISASKLSVNMDYVTHLRNKIVQPLVSHGTAGINESLEVMQTYHLLREDLDNIIELAQWPHQKNPMNMVDSKVKAAFTRAYNKDSAMLPYATQAAATKKRSTTDSQVEGLEDEDDEANSSAEDDDINKDAMVKAKKAPSKKSVKDSEPSTSKKRSASSSSKGAAKRSKK